MRIESNPAMQIPAFTLKRIDNGTKASKDFGVCSNDCGGGDVPASVLKKMK